MNTRLRAATSAASLLLVAAGAVACGGGGGGSSDAKGSDAPTDASKSDFCTGFGDFVKNTQNIDSESDTKAAVSKAKDEVGKLQKTGTPSGISSDARSGFEVFVDTIESIPDNASSDDLKNLGNGLSGTKEKQFEAFITYVGTQCADVLGGASSGSSSSN